MALINNTILREHFRMKLSKSSIILVFAAAILVAGVVIAGCTQASDSGSASLRNQPAGVAH